MCSEFDGLAESYDSSLPPLPEEYIQLIQERFGLSEDDKIIDLGCGSGLLTLALARFSSHVQGIDSSKEMIRIARSRDTQGQVQWICSPVEQFNFGYNLYSLIISLEAFHLFPDPDQLIRKCSLALKPGRYLCIGWINFGWELPLKDTFISVCSSYSITWEDWGYWSCPNFPTIVKRGGIGLSPVVQETIQVGFKTHVRDIATYLASIDKTASLDIEERRRLAQELETSFKRALGSEWCCDPASYSLAYCRKHAMSDTPSPPDDLFGKNPRRIT